MKKSLLMLFFVLLLSGCSNEKKIFISNLEETISIIKKNDMSDYQNKHNYYYINDGLLSGRNFNTSKSKYEQNLLNDVSDYNIVYGKFIINDEKKFIYMQKVKNTVL